MADAEEVLRYSLFFSSRALKQTEYCTIELKTVYRQSDGAFLDLLNRIRENHCDPQVLEALNRRYLPDFQPRKEEGYIRLVTHNYQRSASTITNWNSFRDVLMLFVPRLTESFPSIHIPRTNSWS